LNVHKAHFQLDDIFETRADRGERFSDVLKGLCDLLAQRSRNLTIGIDAKLTCDVDLRPGPVISTTCAKPIGFDIIGGLMKRVIAMTSLRSAASLRQSKGGQRRA
jgi:hypothetical protein